FLETCLIIALNHAFHLGRSVARGAAAKFSRNLPACFSAGVCNGGGEGRCLRTRRCGMRAPACGRRREVVWRDFDRGRRATAPGWSERTYCRAEWFLAGRRSCA